MGQKANSTFLRASSGNMMMFDNLGNLRKGRNTDYHNHDMQRDENTGFNGRYNNLTVENESKGSKKQPGSLCRALSTRIDPEQLKIMGNEDFKIGRFEEALALYDAAIAIDPNKASYRSNKSAALAALGRLLEAMFENRQAIQIEPRYGRAHLRLANMNTRLGETDKALYHYKQAGPEADPDEIAKLKKIQIHLNKCTVARRFISTAKALLKLRMHEYAEAAMSKGPNFDVDGCTKFFGPIANANLLVIQARVHLAAGRLDSNNNEVKKGMRKVRVVASARSNGNKLFKASKFSEACVAYGEGLEYDPYNSVLLCNRAACRSKLGQFEKAVEDCTAALNLCQSYTKARLRRADCNAKLKRWEASIQDYETLLGETPQDEELSRALLETKEHLIRKSEVNEGHE
ncbi:hypothetical protein Fmac_004329 [Flemingia macrophylla]|uniref:Uncharacterized protein n=1 Tax=Flemingia macrophylla TaxID=520843 RepID=A0ABD1N4N2_9FABA